MKKLFTLIAMCLLGVGAMQADESVNLNFNNSTTGTISTDGVSVTSSNVTLKFTTTSSNDKIASDEKTIGGKKYTNYLSIGGAIATSGARVLTLKGISGNGYLTVVFRTIASNTTVNVKLEKSDATVLTTLYGTAATTAIQSPLVSGLDASETYYIVTDNKMGLAGIIWTPTTATTAPGNTYKAATSPTMTLTTSNVPSGITMPTSSSSALTSIKYNDDITIKGTSSGADAKTFMSGSSNYKYDTSVPLQIVKNNVVTIVPAEGVSITSAKVYGTVAANSLTEGTTYQIVDDNDNTNVVSMNLRNTTYSAENWKSITLSGDTKKFHVTNSAAYVAIEIEYTTPASATVNVGSKKWASLYLPANVTIPEGMKAYYAKSASSTENTVTLSEITGAIPANTGVLVNANEGTYNLTIAASATAIEGENLLSGVTEAKNFDNSTIYVLADAANDLPVFKYYAGVTGSTGLSLAAYKAYLPKDKVPSAGSGAKISFVFDGGATAINNVDANVDANKATATRKAMVNGKLVVITANGTFNVAGARIK